ncbi:MAG: DUF1640 domain-containing protein [Nitrospinae bacterium]|nr:DUF1640 domain-containing protein [Nitrospinota bacterium]
MKTIAFDTHLYIKKLKAVGVPEEQAEVQAETIAELLEDNLATKRDLKELEQATKRDLKELEQATKRDLKELETNLIMRLGKMLAVTAGIIIAALSALIKILV